MGVDLSWDQAAIVRAGGGSGGKDSLRNNQVVFRSGLYWRPEKREPCWAGHSGWRGSF